MFNRAVNNHSAASGKISQPSRQAVFGPGSAGGKQDNVPSQWSASSTTNLYGARGPLKPSPSAIINGPNAANYTTSAHGSKSLLTQPNKFPSSLHKADSFKDDSQRVSSFSTSTSQDAASLHDAVYFDENDFDNDSDLDLSTDYVVPKTLKEALTAPKAAPSVPPQSPPSVITYPTLPTLPPAASFEKPSVSSSAPLDWSSSPVEHKKTPPNASLLRREPVSQTHSDYFPPPKRVAPASESNTRDSKRRTLPWLQEPVQHFTPMKDPPALPTKTPKQPTPIWNKTYSAIKEEQKKARKTKKSASAESTGVSKRKVKVDFVQLSQEQNNVLDLVVSKEQSVFFTGPAGTGKSVLLRQIIAELKRKYAREPDRVAVTASTGLAACNIGGITLHSYGGIGLGKEEIPELVKKIKRNAKAKLRWQRTKFLIVDEISMVDGDLFDKLEAIARQIRNNGRPFGGIKLVITGDFFQLPPVPDSGRVSKFAFDAGTWKLSIDHTIGLTHVFRQKDPVFARMLNEMRIGKLTPESINTFKSLSRPIRYDDGIQATELFPTRTEVERSNNSKMASLPGQTQIFTAMDGGSILDINQRDKLLANCMAPIRLELRKGSQVMLIKNIDESLVNGSLGVVVNFMDDKTYSYQESNGEDGDVGGSGDEALNSFKKKLDRMKNDGPGRLWPLVRFQLADGTTRELLCQPESWKIELPNGEVQASRSQVPLILAWALSIHKAQGQTLERVKVDLAKVFERGQAYVALSRATRQDGLQVLNFDARKVMAHPTVTRFYNDLYSVEEALAGRAGNRTGYNGDMGRGRQAPRREIIDIEDEEEALFC